MNKFIYAISILLLASCVSSKKFNQLNSDYLQSKRNLQEQIQTLQTQNTELQSKIDVQTRDIAGLKKNIDETTQQLNDQKLANQRLSNDNSELENQLKSLKAGSSEEIAKLLTKLQQAETDLQKREDKLAQSQAELEKRTLRLQELEQILRQKDEAVKQLKGKVMDALVGFNNKGLTIQEKNGKVYVSLDEQLLFKTGQWEVDPKGQQALANLAEVLAQNPDINVMVEGHTDNVPMHGSGSVKDNWDLSVMRATAVTKILLKNKSIEPKRIVAAGRGEFFPVDDADTPEARKKNRRTEIILTPRLDEIFKLLETN